MTVQNHLASLFLEKATFLLQQHRFDEGAEECQRALDLLLPLYQRQGIGEKLIEHGIQKLKEKGCPYVVVLGHPEYYGRFGFETASNHGIRSEWEGPEVPDDAFMVLVLDKSTMQGVKGLAKYRPEFSSTL